MKGLSLSFLCMVLVCGCSTVNSSRQQQADALASLSPSERDLVRQKEIARGMGTNAVLLAWGEPSEVRHGTPGPGGETEQTWLYFGHRPVLVPRWTYLPDPNGYWTLQYSPAHYSKQDPQAEVHFRNGQVTDWKRY